MVAVFNENIKLLISKAKFHYPAFSAAFFCTPLFYDELVVMIETEYAQYLALKRETIEVGTVIMCRFAFEESVELRKQVLGKDDPHLHDFSLQLEQELDNYLSGTGDYQGLVVRYKLLPPAMCWLHKAPKGLLRKVMCRICSWFCQPPQLNVCTSFLKQQEPSIGTVWDIFAPWL